MSREQKMYDTLISKENQIKQEAQRMVKQKPLYFKIPLEQRKSIALDKVQSNIDLLEKYKHLHVTTKNQLAEWKEYPLDDELNNLKQVKAQIELI